MKGKEKQNSGYRTICSRCKPTINDFLLMDIVRMWCVYRVIYVYLYAHIICMYCIRIYESISIKKFMNAK